MATEVKEEKKLEKKPEKKTIWTTEERENSKLLYGCEIIIENGSLKEVSTKKAPSDASIVKYLYQEKVCLDLTRGSRTSLFDMYYDKFKGELKSIDYGHGTVKPNVWGWTPPATQKKKRKG